MASTIGRVVRRAGFRSIEVDHVQPVRPAVEELLGQAERVAVVAPLVEVPGSRRTARPSRDRSPGGVPSSLRHQARTGSAAATKFASMASPTWPDFSGWNWVPHSAPSAAAAATGPP